MTSDAPVLAPSAAKDALALSTRAAIPQRPARKHPRAEMSRTIEQVMDWAPPPLNPPRRPIVPIGPKRFSIPGFLPTAGATRGADYDAIANYICNKVMEVAEEVSVWLSRLCRKSDGYPETGWRRGRSTPSLSEVFGSIATRPQGPLWKKLMAFLGPGYLVAVGYMDPGNWATSLAGGSKFGYALLTIALLSNPSSFARSKYRAMNASCAPCLRSEHARDKARHLCACAR